MSLPTKTGVWVGTAVELEFDEAVTVAVDPDSLHPEIVDVTQVVCMMVATVPMLVSPDINDVERETVSVQIGTTVLPEHWEEEDEDAELAEEDAELADVLDDGPCVEDDPFVEEESSSPSSFKSSPISARVSVKFSISSRSGTFALMESTRFFTTSSAQLMSVETS